MALKPSSQQVSTTLVLPSHVPPLDSGHTDLSKVLSTRETYAPLRLIYHVQYSGVAANDKRKAAEVLDAVSNPHGQFLLQVPSTFLEERKEES